MDFKEAINYLETLHIFGIKLGLERMTELARLLGNPQTSFKTIHVAGTNGKGSVSAMIASALELAGYRTGLYLSPYVFSFCERVQINNTMISEEKFASIVTRVKDAADEAELNGFGCTTEFEAKTMVAFLYFAEENTDYVVLEVGMGGRFDATNIVDPLLSVITNITLDHIQYLGDTVEEIAFEKAGIIKHNTPIVTAAKDTDALDVIMQKAEIENAPVICVAPKGSPVYTEKHASYTICGDSINISYMNRTISGIHPTLFGAFQLENAATATVALLTFMPDIDENIIKKAIETANLPGRMQKLHSQPDIIIDGAHNEGAAKAVVASMKKINYKRLILVVGMLITHSGNDFLRNLGAMADKVIVTKSSNKNAYTTSELAAIAKKYCADVTEVQNVNVALSEAMKEAHKDDLILVTGSFYTISEIKEDFDLSN